MAESKHDQRMTALQARRDMPAEKRLAAELTVCRLLTELPEVRRAKTVFSYMAKDDELSLSSFHTWAAEQGKILSFPVTSRGGIMKAYAPRNRESLRAGIFGITEPDPERSTLLPPGDMDLVLAPCVAFDGEGHRLGYGGGYYDRYLPKCTRAVKIAVAFEVQRLPSLLTEKTDVTMDGVLTEQGIRYTKN